MSSQCPSCKMPVQPQDTHCRTCGTRLPASGTPSSGGSSGQPTVVVPVSTSSSVPLQAGMVIANRYRLEARIGTGAMGEVWRCADEKLGGRRHAIKQVRLDGLSPVERTEREAWLRREAVTLASLQHPHICQIYNIVEEQGTAFLVLEFIEGRTLAEELEAQQKAGRQGVPVATVLEWARQLCDALSYSHSQTPPLVFRDLKPQNIMLRPDNQVVLIDFGIARHAVGAGGTTIGTPGYAPPEQYQGIAEPRSDQYALAATLHHLLTGRDPAMHAPFHFPKVRTLVPAVDPAVETALDRALSMGAGDRYPTISAFAAALPPSPSRVPPPVRRWRVISVAGLVGILAILAAISVPRLVAGPVTTTPTPTPSPQPSSTPLDTATVLPSPTPGDTATAIVQDTPLGGGVQVVANTDFSRGNTDNWFTGDNTYNGAHVSIANGLYTISVGDNTNDYSFLPNDLLTGLISASVQLDRYGEAGLMARYSTSTGGNQNRYICGIRNDSTFECSKEADGNWTVLHNLGEQTSDTPYTTAINSNGKNTLTLALTTPVIKTLFDLEITFSINNKTVLTYYDNASQGELPAGKWGVYAISYKGDGNVQAHFDWIQIKKPTE